MADLLESLQSIGEDGLARPKPPPISPPSGIAKFDQADATVGRPEWFDQARPLAERADSVLRTTVSAGLGFDTAIGHLRTIGVPDPSKLEGGFKLEEARKKTATEEKPWLLAGLEKVPGSGTAAGILLEREYGKASQRIAAGAAMSRPANWLGRQFGSQEVSDYDFVAQYERLQQIERDRSAASTGLQTLLKLPALYTETLAGGALLRGGRVAVQGSRAVRASEEAFAAAQAGRGTLAAAAHGLPGVAGRTALSPIFYGQEAQRNLNEAAAKGKAEFTDELRAVGAAYAFGLAQNAVVGQLLKPSQRALVGRVLTKTPRAMAEQQAVDALSGLSGIHAGYGLVPDLFSGKHGEALKSAVSQIVTFGTFAGLHGKKPADLARAGAEALGELHREGLSGDEAAAAVDAATQKVKQVFDQNPRATAADVKDALKDLPDDDPIRKVAEVFAGAAAGKAPGPITRGPKPLTADEFTQVRDSFPNRSEKEIREALEADEPTATAEFRRWGDEAQRLQGQGRPIGDRELVEARDKEALYLWNIRAHMEARQPESAKPAPPTDPYAALDEAAVKALARSHGFPVAGNRATVIRNILTRPSGPAVLAHAVRQRAPAEASHKASPAETRPTPDVEATPEKPTPTEGLATESKSAPPEVVTAPGEEVRNAPPAAHLGESAGGEGYFRVPDYKPEGSNLEASRRELGFSSKSFAGLWFSKSREVNDSYHREGKFQYEFDPAKLDAKVGDEIEHRGRDEVGLGGQVPVYLHPAFYRIRFKGSEKSADFKEMARLVETVNEARAEKGLPPIQLEATADVATKTAGMLFKAAGEGEPTAPPGEPPGEPATPLRPSRWDEHRGIPPEAPWSPLVHESFAKRFAEDPRSVFKDVKDETARVMRNFNGWHRKTIGREATPEERADAERRAAEVVRGHLFPYLGAGYRAVVAKAREGLKFWGKVKDAIEGRPTDDPKAQERAERELDEREGDRGKALEQVSRQTAELEGTVRAAGKRLAEWQAEKLRKGQAARGATPATPQARAVRTSPEAPSGPVERLASNMRAMGLDAQEQHVVAAYFAGRALKDIGSDPLFAGVTRQRVHQIKQRALDKLGLDAKGEAELLAQLKAEREGFAGEPEGTQTLVAPKKAPIEVRLERERDSAIDDALPEIQRAIADGADPQAVWAAAIAADPRLAEFAGRETRQGESGPAATRGGEAPAGDRPAKPPAGLPDRIRAARDEAQRLTAEITPLADALNAGHAEAALEARYDALTERVKAANAEVARLEAEHSEATGVSYAVYHHEAGRPRELVQRFPTLEAASRFARNESTRRFRGEPRAESGRSVPDEFGLPGNAFFVRGGGREVSVEREASPSAGVVAGPKGRPATAAELPQKVVDELLRQVGENPSEAAGRELALARIKNTRRGRDLLAQAVAALPPVSGEKPAAPSEPLSEAQKYAIHASLREWRKAVDEGTPGEQTRARNALKKSGAEMIGKVGETVHFDPALHEAAEFSGTKSTGEVERAGWRLPDGTVLARPLVRRHAEQYELEALRHQAEQQEESLFREAEDEKARLARGGANESEVQENLSAGLEAGPLERPDEGRGAHEAGARAVEPDDSAAIAAERGSGTDTGFDFGAESGTAGLGRDFGRPLSPEEKQQGSIGGGQPGTGEAARRAPGPNETALANARVDAERAERGLPPLLAAARRANPEVWDAAMARLTADPQAAGRLVEELRTRPRATTVDENALLLQRKVALRNEHERAVRAVLAEWPRAQASKNQTRLNELDRAEADLAAKVNELDLVTKATGTEWGRAGQFRRQLAREDYSLSSMLARAQLAKGGKPLTPEERATVTRQADEIKDADETLHKAETGETPPKKPGVVGDLTDLQVRTRKAKAAFAETLATIKLQSQPPHKRVLFGAADAFNAARSLVTSFDLSAVFRQGGFFTFSRPLTALKALPESLKALFSERSFDRQQQELQDRPNAVLYEEAGLYLAETAGPLARAEEAFASRLARRIPGVRASERAYTSFLNRVRADVFDSMAASLAREGKPTPAEAKAVANFVNVATGRGPLGGLERVASSLSTVFFSPRYVASRFQLLAGQPLYGGTARARKLVALEYARAAAGLAVFYGVMLAADDDAKLSFDPRSSDFGKLRVGNTRIDPLTGLSQNAVFVTRLLTGETKSAQSGRVSDLRGPKVPYGGREIGDVIFDFGRGKLAPVPGVAADVVTRKPLAPGEKVTPRREAGQLAVPISFRDVFDAMKEQGVPRGVATSVLAVLGMGTQVHERAALRR